MTELAHISDKVARDLDWNELPFHPLADLFPTTQGEEFNELCDSIEAEGLIHPITLDTQGRIIDGRNRYRALRALGTQFTKDGNFYAVFGGGPEQVKKEVIRENILRRNLTAEERAKIVLKIHGWTEKKRTGKVGRPSAAESTGPTQKEMAAQAGVGSRRSSRSRRRRRGWLEAAARPCAEGRGESRACRAEGGPVPRSGLWP